MHFEAMQLSSVLRTPPVRVVEGPDPLTMLRENRGAMTSILMIHA